MVQDKPEGYVNISKRISLRWLPDPPSEPTDTIVYTVGSQFVDLRVRKSDGTIDWAFAGTREVLSEDPLKCRWYHTIDSHGQSDPDEGTFSKLPNGDDLEVGSMPCPEKENHITDYEEVWRDVEPTKCPGAGSVAWVVQHYFKKAFLARIGGGIIGVCRTPNGFGARREEWDTEKGYWKVVYEIGPYHELPSFSGLGLGEEVAKDEKDWKVGEHREAWGWGPIVVRAFEKF